MNLSPATRRAEVLALADELLDLADRLAMSVGHGPDHYAKAIGLATLAGSVRISLITKLESETRNHLELSRREEQAELTARHNLAHTFTKAPTTHN